MQLYGVQSIALRHFLEVARCGSISEASEHLNVAASAVSRQIAKLERDMNCVLFERRARGMLLSDAGARLAAYARKAELEAREVIAEIRDLQGLQRGVVKIGCSEGFAMEFLPGAIAEFRREYQGIHFTLEVFPPTVATEKVRTGEVDLALTFSLSPEREIKVEHAFLGIIKAIVANNHPLAGRAQVTLAELQPYPIALPMPNTTLRQLFDICCSVQGLYFEPALTSNYFGAMYQFVMDGGGISLAGELTLHNRVVHRDVQAIAIADGEMQKRRVELQSMAGRTLPSAVGVFRDFLVAKLAAAEPSLPGEHAGQ
jgi:DNA-binding transcriptional LysR family regulator